MYPIHWITRLGSITLILSGFLVLSCTSDGLLSDAPESLRSTPAGNGPTVLYDFNAKPLPEIPLPNDDAMRFDAQSPTGRRINVSFFAPTKVERVAREAFNQLDGFGTYAPITVSFDKPLDVIDLFDRHNRHAPDEGVYRDDFRNDAVYLLNVDPSCERYGEEVALDMGRGRFPATLYKYVKRVEDEEAPQGARFNNRSLFYFSAFNPHATSKNLLFEERNEDLNGDGILSLEEDRDGDGHLDRANLLHPRACDDQKEGTLGYQQCITDELMTFYERESNTLILRPVWPLEQRCRYAVVLTDRLRGEDGEAVKSPFRGVNPQGQTDQLQVLQSLLPRYGLSVERVAFAWTFTTGTMTRDLEALRAGLYGSGVFSQLADIFPVSGLHLWTRGELDVNDVLPEEVKEDRFLPGGCVGIGLSRYWKLSGEWEANLCAIEADSAGVDKVFGGTFKAPDLLVNRDADIPTTDAYPQTADERWDVEAHTGKITYGETEVTFWCALPEERSNRCSPGNPEAVPFCKPFPTILYAHGYRGSRAEVTTGHLGRTVSMGYAMCALDAYGHGLNILLGDNPFANELRILFSVLSSYGIPDYQQLLMRGRDRDLTNDGLPDSGADMWTSDIFHTRDMVRQTVLEYSQFVRILRSFDGERVDQDGHILGDIDGDGTVDFAGPDTSIGMWGISLGGIISGVLAGSEPALDSVSPNAGGGGLVDIGVRSSQQGVPQAVMLPVLGPFIIGCLPQDEHQRPLSEGTGKSCFQSKGTTPVYQNGVKSEEFVEAGSRAELAVGEMELAFLLNDNARQNEIVFARLSDVRPGDWIELHNLSNEEVRVRRVDDRGRLMIAVPADALTAPERRHILGLSDGDTEPVVAADPLLLGDRLVIKHIRADVGNAAVVRDEKTGEYSAEVALEAEALTEISQFMWETVFQGTVYQPGTPLVALQEGLGLGRNTPAFRRFMGLAQMAIGPGDPAIWSAHVSQYPLEIDYDRYQGGHTHVLQMPTIGDTQVPTSTGIAAARVMGALGSWRRNDRIDPRFGWRELFLPHDREGAELYNFEGDGPSADQILIDHYVVEGDATLERWSSERVDDDVYYKADTEAGEAIHSFVLFDIEDISDGTARFTCGDDDWSAKIGEYFCPDDWKERGQVFPVPYRPGGLRLTTERAEGRYDGLRIPMLRPAGQHGIYNAQPFRYFDADAFMVNFTTRYLATRGAAVDHPEGCDCSSSSIPSYSLDDMPIYPVKTAQECLPEDLRVCDERCSDAWGIRTKQNATCSNP